jgi:pimeloyl-ACP methyl ester carboxylesterase
VRFEVIADAGHVCNVEQPGAYNRALLEFLRKLP